MSPFHVWSLLRGGLRPFAAGRLEHFRERALERYVQFGHCGEDAQVVQGSDAEPRVRPWGDAAGDDALEMGEIGIEIDGDAVKGDPAPDANADGGDFVFTEAK